MAGTLILDTIKSSTSSPPLIENSSGVDFYLARAWINFNGSTNAIRGSGNVSSITDNGTGDYTVNFTVVMPDANYAVNVTGSSSTSNGGPAFGDVDESNLPSTASVRVISKLANAVGGSDRAYIAVTIFC